MITAVSLVNICHHTVTNLLFLVMSTFKIHSSDNIQIYNTVLTIATVLYIVSSGLTA